MDIEGEKVREREEQRSSRLLQQCAALQGLLELLLVMCLAKGHILKQRSIQQPRYSIKVNDATKQRKTFT